MKKKLLITLSIFFIFAISSFSFANIEFTDCEQDTKSEMDTTNTSLFKLSSVNDNISAKTENRRIRIGNSFLNLKNLNFNDIIFHQLETEKNNINIDNSSLFLKLSIFLS